MKNSREICKYIFFGIVTTGVNMASYIFFTRYFILDYKIAASLAWILSVIFAFITNKFFVFESKGVSKSQIMKELLSFIFFRLLSYILDLIAIIILIEWLHAFDVLAKVIANMLVIVFNYSVSKYYIFRLKTRIR